MTRYFVTPTRFVCDSCFASEIGWSDIPPEGWREVKGEERTEHHCASCIVKLDAEGKTAVP